ncbi:predicted protein [Postia placenta Mad-698-R]|uniref:Uncharacterized protein n=1 Tax=Postia placenta MAD-698-R-SB12 TaxID=670580 RepID=A0A1X6NBR4_9APHY|nr:hypothetical protein POSPLADRAFT_1043578 [Postia placenta MAD-698-R-SB12]EED85469.1 predicted protein [Postia placenta Mad-698-R]OSX66079.1 hypothetical protein POSPLADRAFT_1043578 [Postia placenta MAD-698-R-SB12]
MFNTCARMALSPVRRSPAPSQSNGTRDAFRLSVDSHAPQPLAIKDLYSVCSAAVRFLDCSSSPLFLSQEIPTRKLTDLGRQSCELNKASYATDRLFMAGSTNLFVTFEYAVHRQNPHLNRSLMALARPREFFIEIKNIEISCLLKM